MSKHNSKSKKCGTQVSAIDNMQIDAIEKQRQSKRIMRSNAKPFVGFRIA